MKATSEIQKTLHVDLSVREAQILIYCLSEQVFPDEPADVGNFRRMMTAALQGQLSPELAKEAAVTGSPGTTAQSSASPKPAVVPVITPAP